MEKPGHRDPRGRQYGHVFLERGDDSMLGLALHARSL